MKTILMNRLATLQQTTNDNSFKLDYAACYGGYRLVKVGINYAEYGCFGFSSIERRVPAREMISLIDAIIAGIEYGRSNPK